MHYCRLALFAFAAFLLSACSYWPEELKPLAESIGKQVSGPTTAWRVGSDVVVIDVASSPFYLSDAAELEKVGINIARQAIDFVSVPLESVAVTFHENEVSEEPDKMRQLLYLVEENQPVLQPPLNLNAGGPLTLAEIESTFLSKIDEGMDAVQRKCLRSEAEQRAHAAGDPETLDPESVEMLPSKSWHLLDPPGRRLILMQVISTQAAFACNSSGAGG